MQEVSNSAVRSGNDRFGEHRSLGVSKIDFKLSSHDTTGLFVLENIFHTKGGPAKHLHYEQDEWFYCLEGEFQFEIGVNKYTLSPGDSIIGPKKVPHVWAYIGDKVGRLLVTFSPAGLMEAFFREVTKTNAMPPQDPALWRAHGMELLGPPMKLE
jgi:quercetin dioxygenase-like cupin family protein